MLAFAYLSLVSQDPTHPSNFSAPVKVIFPPSFDQVVSGQVPPLLDGPRDQRLCLLQMHQSDLYLPVPAIATARHTAPARLPAAGPTPTWPQSLSSPPVAKKRNVERACDDCRRRKTRCDGSKMPDNVCTNCVQNRKICTYMLAQTFSFFLSQINMTRC